MELRWLVYSNPVTAVEVDDYCRAHGVPQQVALDRLKMRTAPVLQYRNGMGYKWQDTPTVILPHPKNT